MLEHLHLAYLVAIAWLFVLALRWRRRRRPPSPPMRRAAPSDGPVAFGYKASWLALRSGDPREVADALDLTAVHATTWSGGVEQAYRSGAGTVFVTPPVDGWVLALGAFGAGHAREEDLAGLSRRFGEAQLFGTHRVSDFDEWQRWVDGRPVRRYAFAAGEVLFDEGEREGADAHVFTADELDAGDLDEGEEERWPSEELTVAMARQWSVDPTTLDERDDLSPTGLLGHRPR